MAACLVLGGTGFIGSHLAEALHSAGHRVKVFDRPQAGRPSPPRRGDFELVTGDFLDLGDLERALAGTETVFHLVGTTLPEGSNADPVYDVQTNVLGTLRMLELCRRSGAKKIVFVSSGGTIYGVPQAVPIDETHPTNPTCSYGIHKLMIEKHLHLNWLLHGLDYCVLRVANAYGERQRTDVAQGAVSVFLERALRGETIQIWGDGSVVRDYVYVGDVANALLKALGSSGAQKTFNIGSGVGVSLNQLVDQIAALTGRRPAVEYAPGRRFDVPANVLDCSLARRLLGWKPETRLAEGLRRTRDWMQRAR